LLRENRIIRELFPYLCPRMKLNDSGLPSNLAQVTHVSLIPSWGVQFET